MKDLTEEFKKFLNETKASLKGSERRLFMARFVSLLGYGGQSRAERELGWARPTIRKGMAELRSGITSRNNSSGKGRKPVEKHLINLLDDIRDIESISQTDSSSRETSIYAPITASEVRRRLKKDKNYTDAELPTVRTINNKLHKMGFRLKKGDKSKNTMK